MTGTVGGLFLGGTITVILALAGLAEPFGVAGWIVTCLVIDWGLMGIGYLVDRRRG